MIEIQRGLLAPSPETALVSSASAGGVAVALAAAAQPDLLLAAAAERSGAVVVVSRRPVRARSPAGYAPEGILQTKPVKTTATSSPSKASPSKPTSSSKPSTSSSSSSSKTSGALGFLNDSSLSVEEKLFRFLCYVADKYEKELDKKLKEIGGKPGSGASSSKGSTGSGSSGGKGLLESVLGGGGGGGVLGALGGGLLAATGLGGAAGSAGLQDLISQASGPVLAAGACVFGFPELAPVLLKVGPELTQGAFGLLGGAGTPSGAGSTSGSSTSSSTSSSKAGEPEVDQKDMLEIQRLQDKQKEMFSMVSNMLRTMHETKMAVIGNLHA